MAASEIATTALPIDRYVAVGGNIDSLHVIETYDQIKDEDQHRPVALNFAPPNLWSRRKESFFTVIG